MKQSVFWLALLPVSSAYASSEAVSLTTLDTVQLSSDLILEETQDLPVISPQIVSPPEVVAVPELNVLAQEADDPRQLEPELAPESDVQVSRTEVSRTEVREFWQPPDEMAESQSGEEALPDDFLSADQAETESASTSESLADPELGNLRLRELEVPEPPPPPTIFLVGGIDYFRSDNILLDFDPVDDGLVRSGLSLFFSPILSPKTAVIAAVEGNLVRYNDLSDLNYNELRFRAGIRHFFSSRTFGELGWTNQQLFVTDQSDRFFNDHSVRLTVGRRDPLADSLTLDSFYQLRVSFADPSDRSRIVNLAGLSLSYDLQPDLEAELSYQFIFSDFTQQDRQDAYSQLIGQLSYDLTRTTQITLFGGFSFGGSTRSDVDFDSSILGVSLNISLPLF